MDSPVVKMSRNIVTALISTGLPTCLLVGGGGDGHVGRDPLEQLLHVGRLEGRRPRRRSRGGRGRGGQRLEGDGGTWARMVSSLNIIMLKE